MNLHLPLATWQRVAKGDVVARDLADRHYSRRKVGSPQFMPPGETIVLVGQRAVFGWWRSAPSAFAAAMNGLDGWTCTIFRNEGDELSSDLVLAAELQLRRHALGCGRHGMLTYVEGRKVRSTNPGFCFKVAGWVARGLSKDGRKVLLQKHFELAGAAACAVDRRAWPW